MHPIGLKIESLKNRGLALPAEITELRVAAGLEEPNYEPIPEERRGRVWQRAEELRKAFGPYRDRVETLSTFLLEMLNAIQDEIESVERDYGRTHVYQTLAELAKVEQSLDEIQTTWQLFRTCFEQRVLPYVEPVMPLLDAIAFDCYFPVLDEARRAGLPESSYLKEPPLTYLDIGLGVAPWRRHVQAQARQGAPLPIPLVRVPREDVDNVWNLMAICHEVGHDIYHDLNLEEETRQKIYLTLKSLGVSDQKAQLWITWHAELFADLFGTLIAGPAFVDAGMERLAAPPEQMLRFDPHDPHPTPYLRPFVGTFLIREMGFVDEAVHLEEEWVSVFGSSPEFQSFFQEIPYVVHTLVHGEYQSLKGRALSGFVRVYSQEEDRTVTRAKAALLREQQADCRPLQAVCAARYAFRERPERRGVIANALRATISRYREMNDAELTRQMAAVRPKKSDVEGLVFEYFRRRTRSPFASPTFWNLGLGTPTR
jgi:hypothetical protein